MADTTTPNLSLVKPELTKKLWGEKMNANLDKIDAAVVKRTGGSTVGGTLFWRGADNNNAIIAKPAGDGRAGVFDLIHNDSVGYLFHLVMSLGADHQASAAIALGIDEDGIGLLAVNKKLGRGIVGDQRATVTNAAGYWLHATQRSPAAPLVRLEMQANDAADLLQVMAFGTPGPDQKLMYVGDPAGQAGAVYAANGLLEWKRSITVMDKDGTTPSLITVTDNGGVPIAQRTHLQVRKSGLEAYNYSGTAGTWFPFRIRNNGSHLQLEAGGATTTVGTATTTVLIDLQNNKLGFFGATPVVKPTLTYSKGTESAAETQIRTALAALGLLTDSTVA